MNIYLFCSPDIPDILQSAFRREGDSFLDDYEDDFEDEDDDDDDDELLATKISVEEMWETFRNNPTVRRLNGRRFSKEILKWL